MSQYPFGGGYRKMEEENSLSYPLPEIKMETNLFNNPPHYVQPESSYNTCEYTHNNNIASTYNNNIASTYNNNSANNDNNNSANNYNHNFANTYNNNSANTYDNNSANTYNNNSLLTETMVLEEFGLQQLPVVKNEFQSLQPVGKISPKDWCQHVDDEYKRGKLTDYDICKTISSPFMGVRSKPLDDAYLANSPSSAGTSSERAQSSKTDYCNDIVALRNFKFDFSNPSQSVYRALNLWKSIIHEYSECEAVEAVIGCIDNEKLRGFLLTKNCSTIPELIYLLTRVSNTINKSSYSPPTKRARRKVERTWHSPDRPEQHLPVLNLDKVCQDEEFLKLTPQELICLIRKDELNVREEREVYNAVLSWVKFDEDRRYPRMEHILQAVRCQYLTPSFLKEQMSTCSVLQKVPACREYLAKIFQDLTLHKKPIVKERRPNTPRIIYVAGGYFRHSIDVFEAFNLDDNCWTTLSRLTVPRSGLGAAFLKGLFYAVGGRNTSPGSSYDSDWVDVYSPAAEQWRPCSPMATPRHRVGVAVMDGLLYAVGGSANSEYHKTVECYDPEKDTWTYTASMGRARLGVGVAVVNRLLYAVGGFDGARRSASVESYHPENNRWTEVAPMKYARSGAGVAAWNQYIYVVGGYDGTAQLASVERYDTERDVWEEVSPMKAARSALSLAVLDNKLYAMGGYDGASFLDVVEIYDPCSDAWSDGTALPSARSGHASAVCYQHLAPHDLDPARRHDDVMTPGVVQLHAAAGRL